MFTLEWASLIRSSFVGLEEPSQQKLFLKQTLALWIGSVLMNWHVPMKNISSKNSHPALLLTNLIMMHVSRSLKRMKHHWLPCLVRWLHHKVHLHCRRSHGSMDHSLKYCPALGGYQEAVCIEGRCSLDLRSTKSLLSVPTALWPVCSLEATSQGLLYPWIFRSSQAMFSKASSTGPTKIYAHRLHVCTKNGCIC